MALFPAIVKNTEEALNYLAGAISSVVTPLVSAATTLTLTTAQFINGILNTAGGTTCTATTPTAAAIVAALAYAQVGSHFTFNVVNTNSGTTTVAGGTDVTVTGVATVATNTSATFRGIVTNIGSGTEAVTLFRV